MGNPSKKMLENLKDSLVQMMADNYFDKENKPIKFKTDNYEIKSVTRLPNEKEKIVFIQETLQRLYFCFRKINKDQYKTARRQCINDRESVLRFISKIEGEENIFEHFNYFCNNERDYIEGKVKVTFNNIARTIVDIDINK